MGTAFVVADEALSAEGYRERVIAASEADTALTERVYDLGFEGAPVRTLENSTIRRWRDAGEPSPGDRPGEGEVVAVRPDGTPVLRYDFAPPVAGLTGELEALANFAGQGVGVIHTGASAAAIVRRTVAEAQAVLDGLGRAGD